MILLRHMHFLLLPFVLLLTGCSWSVDTDLAELSVAEFHERYNRGSYDTIYANASPDFQSFVKTDKFIHLLEKLHGGLGQYKSSSLINWSAKSTLQQGIIITLIYNTVYENDATAKETFSFKVNDGLAQLYNFNVSSAVLAKKKPSRMTDI
ncbi:MAG: hypothetical protein JKY59_10155 [Emcibacter sp.]|nr:hypothetical protein [Emcibacter sp.]